VGQVGNGGRDQGAAPDTVAGERTIASVNRAPSLQSRFTNLLALALVGSLAIGFLGWYYAHVVIAHSEARRTTHAAGQGKTQAEMALPPLGRVNPPAPSPSVIERALDGAPPAPPPAEEFARGSGSMPGGPYAVPGLSAPPSGEKSKAQLALERRLAGPVFAGPTSAAPPPAITPGEEGGEARLGSPAVERRQEGSDLAGLLRPAVTPAVAAQVLPTQRLLLPKGAFLDCTLETAIDSTLPGMTTCVLATDTFSADGSVVLLERGTKLVGETRGEVHQGAARVFVLWTEARTPTGVIVPLASPGTDELGRSGLPGEVDRHFWERFGAAILVTVLEGAVQGAVQSQSNGNAVVVNPTGSIGVMSEILRSTIDIPPTVRKASGDRIQVFVARDLDFRSVYELRPTAGR
jgi:type IV secretion system protein VirB10